MLITLLALQRDNFFGYVAFPAFLGVTVWSLKDSEYILNNARKKTLTDPMTDLMTVSMSGHFRTLAVVSIHSTFLVLNFKMPYFETKRGSFFLFTLFTFLLFLAPIPKWGHRVETVALVICCRHPLDQYGVARRSKRSESSLLFFHTYLFLFLIDPNRSFDMEAPDLFEV